MEPEHTSHIDDPDFRIEIYEDWKSIISREPEYMPSRFAHDKGITLKSFTEIVSELASAKEFNEFFYNQSKPTPPSPPPARRIKEGVSYPMPPSEPLTPFEYKKETDSEATRSVAIASISVVSYMFLTGLLGNFLEFGGIWWAIVFSYLVAIGGGVSYCISKFISNEELVKEYSKQYKKK